MAVRTHKAGVNGIIGDGNEDAFGRLFFFFVFAFGKENLVLFNEFHLPLYCHYLSLSAQSFASAQERHGLRA